MPSLLYYWTYPLRFLFWLFFTFRVSIWFITSVSLYFLLFHLFQQNMWLVVEYFLWQLFQHPCQIVHHLIDVIVGISWLSLSFRYCFSWFLVWWFYYYYYYILEILAIHLVILFRFSTWTMIYFCELLFQEQFNFQRFCGVIVLVYLFSPLAHAGAASLAEDGPQVGVLEVPCGRGECQAHRTLNVQLMFFLSVFEDTTVLSSSLYCLWDNFAVILIFVTLNVMSFFSSYS